MSDQSPKLLWPIDYSLMTSITHIYVIDYSSMTHWLLKDYYTVHERHFPCFLVHFSFVNCDYFICLRAFFLVSEVPVDDVEAQSANHKCRWFSIVQYFTLPNSLFTNKTTEQ